MSATREQIIDFMATEFPQSQCRVEAVGDQQATVSMAIDHKHLRPGGTVSGPTLMTLADVALYVAILGEIGIVPLAVTTNLNVNFLRRPAADTGIIGVCELMKVGRSLAVGEVYMYSQGSDKAVAHAVGTYSIPPDHDTPR